ncbi:MAG: hypothetical protein KGJ09_01790 [Candidatus Omnitrophica bacterium]|nr:hypothetical protein [Candidatus Omnitrophota bacterium]MDE2008790.1 hypothetical protein [Candidatus Omnitrophota bacterium]MDE2213647.1 hypothetical protein [Candidatus Omnitrophota bacterium]MDE2230452.1 hypothetical protein [Candidatus Omnitrophota bacterium]
MFSIFKKYAAEKQLSKSLYDLLAEMEKNLEFFYVMDQRQFITHGFLTDAWGLVKDMEIIRRHETILKYGSAMEDFNGSLKAYKDFETWYAGDVNNKNAQNARKLHALKSELDQKLKAMEAVIILAGQDLEREMLKLGLLKS